MEKLKYADLVIEAIHSKSTERYLGSRQRLVGAVNDHFGIEREAQAA